MGDATSQKIKPSAVEWMAALDRAEAAIFVHDKAGCILHGNRAYQRYAGLPLKQVVGRPYFDIYPKTHVPLPGCLSATGRAATECAAQEVQVGPRTFRSRACTMVDGHGGDRYCAHILEDITAWRRIERELSESGSQYRRLFESVEDGVLLVAADSGTIVDANPFALELLSCDLDACVGKKVWELGSVTGLPRTEAGFRKLQAEGGIRCDHAIIQAGDSKPVAVELACHSGTVDGQKVIQCNIRDIGERLHTQAMLTASQDLLQSVVENIPERVFWKDTQLRYLGCNTAFAHDAGMSSPQELLGKDDFQMGWAEQAERYRADDQKVIDSGTPKVAYEEPQSTPDGRQIWLRTSKVPLRDADGSISGLLGLYDDITDRKRAESDLLESAEKYRAIFQGALDGIVLADIESRQIIDGNAAICRMLGYSIEEFTQLGVPDIHPRKDWPYVFDQFEKQARGEIRLAADMPLQRKDGSVLYADINTASVEFGGRHYLLGVFRDITQRRSVEASLKLFRHLIDNTNDAIEVIDPVTMRFLDMNETGCRTLGYSRDELLSMRVFDVDKRFDADSFRAVARQIDQTGVAQFESVHQRRDGSTYPVEISAKRVELDKPYIMSVVRDVTERKRSEDTLRASELSYRTLTQNMPGLVYRVFLREGRRMEFFNAMSVEITGYAHDELKGGTVCLIEPLILDEDRRRVIAEVRSAVAAHRSFAVEYRLKHKTRGIRWLTEYGEPVYGEDGEALYIDGLIFDITERRKAQESVRQSEEKFRTLVESTSDWIWEVDQEGMYTYASPQVEVVLGYRPEEVLGRSPFEFMLPEEVPGLRKKFQESIGKRVPIVALENSNFRKDGRRIVLETSGVPFFDAEGEFAGYRGIDRDITERKQDEVALKRANRALKMLSEVNVALVRAESEDALLHQVTEIIVTMSDYRLAVVGYAGSDAKKTLTPKAWSGTGDSFYLKQKVSWADTDQGQLPIARAIRDVKTQICRDLSSEPGYERWRRSALARGYVANIAMPLTADGAAFGALSIYSSDANAFDEDEVRLLGELADDLAYGIESLRRRVENERHAIVLRQSLEQFIQTIAATVEMRDPYTAGHQRRVGELAKAIAQEMGLPDDQVNGIHLAAIIHDLGKIQIPAEILSNPGKLSDIAFMFIKTHPQAGYDLLKNVSFPWPIAEIILQHHERLDGTGYPRGLKGDQILLDARIVTVADVVEAMSSHRPYRSALGILAALDEIRRGSGSKFDPVVVDTCLKLFSEKGFAFSAK